MKDDKGNSFNYDDNGNLVYYISPGEKFEELEPKVQEILEANGFGKEVFNKVRGMFDGVLEITFDHGKSKNKHEVDANKLFNNNSEVDADNISNNNSEVDADNSSNNIYEVDANNNSNNIYEVDTNKLLELLIQAKIGKDKNKGLINLSSDNIKINFIKNELDKNKEDILGKNATYILKNSLVNPKLIYVETKRTENELYYFISSVDGDLVETYAVNGEEFKNGIDNKKISIYRIQGYDNSLLTERLNITEANYGVNVSDINIHYGLNEYYRLKEVKRK